ncbi:MAG: 16S rRNA processing protein RimM [Ardenticatenaceae bacterium]|nr:16S rRNA processing protein RimM [Anaerolineales bacterium]MCB8937485.1 16S rRNA processing protein RimM [Ardenticatenaceae bacterium]MCB8975534.1 16S rRNA processing protein RimM [Ardenticatenaceae bacterium]
MSRQQSAFPDLDGLDFIVIGQITKPHGVRGEVRVKPHTDEPERFSWLEQVYVGAEDPRPMAVEQARVHQGMVLLKLTAVSTRAAAESLRGEWLLVPEDEALPLEEGEYFLFELEGLTVVTTDGETLGTLTGIIETGANNVFVVQGDRGELLLPDIDDVVQDIDFENGRMLVTLLPGLIQ